MTRLRFIILSLIAVIACFASENVWSQEGGQALKVKSIVGGNFDRESRQNLRTLLRLGASEGTVLVWVATNAPYDADLRPGEDGYEDQEIAIRDYHLVLLSELDVSPNDANLTAKGPYVSAHVSPQNLWELLLTDKVKGYWGIVQTQ